MKSLDQLDPLPSLGAKIEPIECYYKEDKQIGPDLFIDADGRMSYRPPMPYSEDLTLAYGEAMFWSEW